jgi:hypothetical protein
MDYKQTLRDFFRLLNKAARAYAADPLSYEIHPRTFYALFWRLETVCWPVDGCPFRPCRWLADIFTAQRLEGLDAPIDGFYDLIVERAAELQDGVPPYVYDGWFYEW